MLWATIQDFESVLLVDVSVVFQGLLSQAKNYDAFALLYVRFPVTCEPGYGKIGSYTRYLPGRV